MPNQTQVQRRATDLGLSACKRAFAEQRMNEAMMLGEWTLRTLARARSILRSFVGAR